MRLVSLQLHKKYDKATRKIYTPLRSDFTIRLYDVRRSLDRSFKCSIYVFSKSALQKVNGRAFIHSLIPIMAIKIADQ